jgi:cyclase
VISRTVGRLCLIAACAAVPAFAEAPAKVKADKLTSRIQYLQLPPAGNVTLFTGDESLLVVDSGNPNSTAIADKIASLSPKPVAYLVDTHYHDDHTGGNVAVAHGGKIVASQACLKTMRKNRKPEQKPEAAGLPQETYGSERGLLVGKQMVRLMNFGPAHTAGDTIVIFESEGVVAAGDLFFNGLPPYIDVADGADTENWVKVIRAVAERFPKYKVIPGHGPVAGMKEWLRFADYLSALRERVAAAIATGQTRDQAVASVKLDEFPEVKDVGVFLTKAQNVGWVYDELKRGK